MIFHCKAEDTIKGQPFPLQPSDLVWLCEVQEKAKKMKKELINITVGMKVMVTQNVETDLDITNGAQGTIVGTTLHPDKPTVSKGTSQCMELQCSTFNTCCCISWQSFNGHRPHSSLDWKYICIVLVQYLAMQ